MIKPIETRYKGYRFRSRLEARWAVCFDAANIKWVYEPQGFVIDGKPYLPDFYLPKFGYFEVKGRYEYDDQLMQSFADEIQEPIFIAFEQIPDPESCKGYLKSFNPRSFHEDSIMHWGFGDMFLQCDGCSKVTIQNEAYCTIKDNCCRTCREMTLSHALEAARAARFEHGETPKI